MAGGRKTAERFCGRPQSYAPAFTGQADALTWGAHRSEGSSDRRRCERSLNSHSVGWSDKPRPTIQERKYPSSFDAHHDPAFLSITSTRLISYALFVSMSRLLSI